MSALLWIVGGMSEYEAEDRRIVVTEQYRQCLAAYSAAGEVWKATRSRSAMDVKLGREPHWMDMRREMTANGCRP
jgi:hypothetical protein